MKLFMKLALVVLAVVLSFGIFFTPNANADEPYRTEIVYENGQWVKYVYDVDGGVVEVIIITSN